MSRLTLGLAGGAIAGVLAAVVYLGGETTGLRQAARADGPSPSHVSPLREAGASSADRVTVVRPSVEDFHFSTREPAHVEPYERTDVYAKAAGYLEHVHVDIGDRVKKGQVLAVLWIPEMDQELLQKAAQVEDARAAEQQATSSVTAAGALIAAAEKKLAEADAMISQYEAEVAYRRQEHQRYAELSNSRSVINEAVVDEKLNLLRSAESALTAARARERSADANVQVERARELQAVADLARARAQLKVAEANFDYTKTLMDYAKIRAPYDGVITRRWVDSGDFVTSAASSKAEPLFTVDRDERLRIVFDVPESKSSLVHLNQSARLVVDALKGRSFEGRIARTTSVLDPNTRTLRSEVELDRVDPALRPGMYGMITVTLAERPQTVMLPTRCLQYEDGQPFVYCAGHGAVEKRSVAVGYSDGIRSEIVDGLDASDLVVVESRGPIRPGDSVRVALSNEPAGG